MLLKIMLEVNYVGHFQLENKFHYFYQAWSSLALNHSMLYQVVFLVIKLFFSALESSVVMQKLTACLFSCRSCFSYCFQFWHCAVQWILLEGGKMKWKKVKSTLNFSACAFHLFTLQIVPNCLRYAKHCAGCFTCIFLLSL